jgi:hypothetical protein
VAGQIGRPYGDDGILPFTGDAYALPLGFVRALIREVLMLLNRTFEAIASIEGVTSAGLNAYLGPSGPYESAALDFNRSLPIDLGLPAN